MFEFPKIRSANKLIQSEEIINEDKIIITLQKVWKSPRNSQMKLISIGETNTNIISQIRCFWKESFKVLSFQIIIMGINGSDKIGNHPRQNKQKEYQLVTLEAEIS